MNSRRIFSIAILMFIGISVFPQKGMINNGAKISIIKNAVLKISGGTSADYTNETSGSEHGRIDLDGKIILEGDWFNNATSGYVLINIGTGGEVKFVGSSAQTIGGTRATYFEKLTLDNSNGISLGNDITMYGNLSLSNGNILLGSNNLTLHTSSNILGTPSATRMIIASGGGELRKRFSGTGSFTFPVGDNSGTNEYSPATLNFTSGTFGGSAYAGISLSDSKHANNSSLSNFLSRYWTVNQSNISSFSCDVTFTYLQADVNGSESSIYGGQWESPNWIKLNPVNTSSNLVTGTVSTFSDFTGGENSEFSIGIEISDDMIAEAAENGEIIYVTLINDEFVGTLDPDNWTIDNLPQGVTKGSVSRTSDTQATITLSGNRTTDYDSDITNVMVTIGVDELVFSTSDLVAGTGVTLIANGDAESIAISDDGITEGSENGENITVTLSGGTFVGSLNPSNWTLTNLPDGVSKNTVTRNSATQVTINLSGNRTTDYDTDITDFMVSVTADEIDDYSGNDISVSTGVTFNAIVESAIIVHAGLTESNLDGALIELELVNETFNDVTLDKTNFSLKNAPPGTSVSAVNYVNTDTATVTLAFDGTDFDINYTDFSITISVDELSGAGYVTSNTLTVTANVEAATATITHAGLTEGNLNSADIGFILTAETFADATLDPVNFILGNAPDGTTVSAVTWISTTEAIVALAFDGTDFDNNITNFYVVAAGAEVTLGSSVASSTLPVTATDDAESVSMADDGDITEGNEDSEVITVTLTGGTFVDPVTTSNWFLTNLPAGVTKGALVRTDAIHATIVLSGSRTTDYDSDITSLILSINTDEINDTSGSDITTNTGVTFIANDESVIISHTGLDENNLNGAVIGIKLVNETFINAALDLADFTINNVPPGTTKNGISYEGADTATITLAFDGTDFDTDFDYFSVEIDVSELSGLTGIISNELIIAAIDEPGVLTISHGGLTEENLNNANILLTLDQETFDDASLISTNFTLYNVPPGVSIGAVTYISATTATLTLVFDGTDFDSDINNFNIIVSAVELTGIDDLNSNVLGITATNDAENISMTDDGAISEGNENGEIIIVTLSGGTFVDILTPGNWSFTGLPDGVSIFNVTRDNAIQVTIILNGNRATDYDADIANASLNVDAAEVNDYSGADLTTTGIVFTAIFESATINHAGLTENNLDGAEIGLKLTNESFSDPILSVVSFNLNNAPVGTTVNTVTYYSTDTATVTLAFDGTDFDADSTNFSITISASELTGAGDITSDNLTIEAVDEPETAVISHAGLSETNLDGADIDLTLSDVTFADAILDKDNFTLNNVPEGTTIDVVTYNSSTNATVTLVFDGTDFDADIANFSITIALDELSNGSSVTSNNLTITAVIETKSISITDPGLSEESLNGSVVTISLTNIEFTDSTLNKSNFTLNNAPAGTTVDSVSYVNSFTATLTFSYDETDFDDDIYDFSITLSAGEITGSSDLTSNEIFITAFEETPTLTISHSTGITENNLDGAVVNLVLNEVTFEDVSLVSDNFTLNNAPTGTTVNSVNYISATEATLTLAFNGMDFDTDFDNFSVTVSSVEVLGAEDITSNVLSITAVIEIENATISHVTGLTEENLDSAVITLVLSNITFIDGTLSPPNFLLNNAPSGTLVSSVSYTGSAAATVTLAYDGSDFDTDVTNFSITISSAELSGGTALTSNTLTIIASVENESVTISFDGLSGDNLDGAGIEIELFNVRFADTIPDKVNYTLNNAPAGTGVDTVIYLDSTHATLAVEFDGTVFNDTIYDFSITISSIELTGLDDLKSNDLAISPVTGISPYPEALDINMYSFENRIFIECSDPEKLKEVAIYNILGSELIRRKLDKNPVNEISLDVPGNYYFIRVYTTDNKTYSKKLLIYLR